MTSNHNFSDAQQTAVALSTAMGKSSSVHDAKGSNAWLLQYASGRYIVLPMKNCQEVIESPKVLPVPGIAEYGEGLVRWRGLWLPLINLARLLRADSDKQAAIDIAVVIAYRQHDASIAYAALVLTALPQVIRVSDEALCALPEGEAIWPQIAPSCIRYQDYRVPIVDSHLLFSRYHEQ